ncbi:MAG: NAD(P)/FAD-dependent oxidoreductase, partial [Blastocatellia bacterium]|nr:NAD(P)/FAD-dependent oxidoreductase [Blastocatellia bacterium]
MFLGAPFALAACREGAVPERFPSGEIVGANVELGHILRERRNFEVPTDRWENISVAIVGSGVAGLSAAWKLERDGVKDFVVLELEKEVGGTSRSADAKPVPHPWGAHYLPVPFQENTDLLELLTEMDLLDGTSPAGEAIVKEQYLCREPEERIFYKGRWYHG